MTAPALDALIERCDGLAGDGSRAGSRTMREAAAALVQLRKEVEQLDKNRAVWHSAKKYEAERANSAEAEVARLKSEVEFLHKRRGEIVIDRDRYRAALGKYPEGRDVMLDGALAEVERSRERIKALEEERDALQKNCTALVQMFELASSIPSMSDEQLRQLVANGRAAIDAAREKP